MNESERFETHLANRESVHELWRCSAEFSRQTHRLQMLNSSSVLWSTSIRLGIIHDCLGAVGATIITEGITEGIFKIWTVAGGGPFRVHGRVRTKEDCVSVWVCVERETSAWTHLGVYACETTPCCHGDQRRADERQRTTQKPCRKVRCKRAD